VPIFLRFEPGVRWMWIPQTAFAGLFGLWSLGRIRARRIPRPACWIPPEDLDL